MQISGWVVGEDRDTPYDGSAETPNPLRERTRVRVYLFTADVRVNDLTGVQVTATVPDVTRSAVVVRPASSFEFSETFRGAGDTSVVVWRRFVSSTGWNVTLNGGVSLPTGKTEAPRFRSELDDDSLVPLSRLQRRTGTFDPIAGVTVNRIVEQLFPPGTRVFFSAAARLPIAENSHGLRTGGSWEVGLGGSREVLGQHWLVAIARASWLHRAQDTFEGRPVLVGGGDWIVVSPAVAVNVGPVTLQGELRLPVHRSLANRQLDAARGYQFGATWSPF